MKVHALCIHALDLKCAFDNVTHGSFLEGLNKIGCGKAAYDYIRSLLWARKATLPFGDTTSKPATLSPRGMPRSDGPSPLPFNLAMRKLSSKLNDIPDIEHAMCAYQYHVTV